MQKSKLLIISVTVVLFYVTTAYASVNIPVNSSFYGDVNTLISKGLIESNLSSTKPFTRAEAGRLVAEAIEESEEKEVPTSAANLLDRMSKEYKDEISEARAPGSAPRTFLKPVDEFSVSYNFMDGPYSTFNNEGIDYYDGHNAMIQFQSMGRLWNVFSYYIEPMILYNQQVGNVDGNDETEVRLHKGYIKFTTGDFEIAVGRDSLWWGPGYHGSLLISNNARPFDMIKLSNERAVLLPWIFSYLGPFRFNLIFSRLDDDDHNITDAATGDDLSKPYLHGLRLNFKPHPLLEVGLSHLVMFGGEGRSTSFKDFFKIAYSNQNRDGTTLESNQELAIDLALSIPNVDKFIPLASSIKLYGEIGAEDTGTPPDRRAYLAGITLNDAFTVKGMQLRVEYADLSPDSVPTAWYRHASYPMSYKGRGFGHHAGSDSDDLFVELSQTFENSFSYKIGFDKERNGISQTNIQEKYQYFLETGYDIDDRVDLTLRYAYEEINNSENIKDNKQKNHFIGIELEYDF
ncbi:MAG: capsule assembly Wzi family protein [Deltaproteobacteria bacterium]|nr:capsule assembly Wzi family protein [Deltaproteobacteria bacterium]